MFHQAHDALGHNNILRMYKYMKHLKGLRTYVEKHVTQCLKCRLQNLAPQRYALLLAEMPLVLMHIITVEFKGRYKASLQCHIYILTTIDLLTNCVWCIFLIIKEADKVVHAYLVNVNAKM